MTWGEELFLFIFLFWEFWCAKKNMEKNGATHVQWASTVCTADQFQHSTTSSACGLLQQPLIILLHCSSSFSYVLWHIYDKEKHGNENINRFWEFNGSVACETRSKKSHSGFTSWEGWTTFPEPRKPWFIKQSVRSVSTGGGKGWRRRRLWETNLLQIFRTRS